jgi:flagellar basal-body rod modification protein FlgD
MTTINPAATATSGSTVSSALDRTEIASNFTTFLQLLTTQLKNQNPLDPLDTNQFTQQLVEFAQVEQQMKSNDQLSSLVALEKSAQATTALAYVGATVVVDGATAQLANGSANWSLNVTKPSTATITIKDSTGQNVFTGTVAVNPGTQTFTWNGRGNDGRIWPDGSYTLTATAVDANKQSVAISTEGAGDRGFRRPDAGSAAAVDQRPELHAGQDQAHCSTNGMSGLTDHSFITFITGR